MSIVQFHSVLNKDSIAAKLDIDRGKVYRVNDSTMFASIFLPQKSAANRRAAFLAILFELKNQPGKRLASTDHIAVEYGLSPSCVTKTRVMMARTGIIRKREGSWQFSSVFKNMLNKILELLEVYTAPSSDPEARKRERQFIEMAKRS